MVTPSDPYHFILSESFVSSSQEATLQRIPGWDDAKLHDSLTPSQPPLAASQQQDLVKLCCSVNSGSEDFSSQREPGASLFGVQGPMEWASPDTELEKDGDSYNAAFESDRSQSPSSQRPWYGPIVADLFSARFITQSQVVSEKVFESEPSTSKDMAQCLKTDKSPADVQGSKAGEPAVDSHAERDQSRDNSFNIPPATEHKCATRKTEEVDRGESLIRHSGSNKQAANCKDLRIFPESVIDVVMFHSGCLPPCKPDDPDFLSLVTGSGVSLPLPFRSPKLQYH